MKKKICIAASTAMGKTETLLRLANFDANISMCNVVIYSGEDRFDVIDKRFEAMGKLPRQARVVYVDPTLTDDQAHHIVEDMKDDGFNLYVDCPMLNNPGSIESSKPVAILAQGCQTMFYTQQLKRNC